MTNKFFEEFWVSVFVPFQVFGLSPRMCHPKNIVKSNILPIYNIMIGVVVAAIILITFLNKRDIFDGPINIMIDYILLYAFLFAHLIVVIEINTTYFSQSLFSTKLTSLADVFHKKFNHDFNLHPLLLRCLKKIWSASLLSFLVIFIVEGTWDDFWELFGRSVFSIIVTRIRFIQISIYVDILTEYLHRLGIVLQELQSNFNSEDRFQMLLIVKDVYGSLIELNNLIEKIFRWSMAAIIILNFVDMLNQGYWTFVNIFSLRSLSFGINIIFFIVGLSIPLLHLVSSCHQYEKQSLKISSLLHSLSSEQFSIRQAELIEAISLKIRQQPIQVQVMGAFTVNYNLLAKFAGSIATYLTILLQFQLREMDFN